MRNKLVAAFAAGFIVSSSAFAGPMISIDNVLGEITKSNTDPHLDVDIGFNIMLYSYNSSEHFANYTNLPINKVSISTRQVSIGAESSPYSVFAAFTPLSSYARNDIFSVYYDRVYGDIDIGYVTYGTTTFEGRSAFAVDWFNAAIGSQYQVVLVDRSDIAEGDFDYIFNYSYIDKSAPPGEYLVSYYGSAVKYTGDANDPYRFEDMFFREKNLSQSEALALPYNSLNSDVEGRYVFEVRGGVSLSSPIDIPTSPIPEPETYAMLLVGLGLVTQIARRQQRR